MEGEGTLEAGSEEEEYTRCSWNEQRKRGREEEARGIRGGRKRRSIKSW